MILAGQSYAKGLSLRSRSKIQYRLPNGYTRLKFVAGIDDRIRSGGAVKLTILGDQAELYTQAIVGGEPPREIDLAIDGVKQLEIDVDYGDDSDLGDYLNLGNARITK